MSRNKGERGRGGGGWMGVYESAFKISPWIRNPGKKSLITRNVQYQGSKSEWIRNPLQLQDPEIP